MKVAMLPVIALVGLLAGLAVTAYPAHGQQPNCGYYRNSNGHEVPRPCGNWHATPRAAPPNGATALCGDGTYSYSEHPYASGTCSHHGGVVQHVQ